MGSRGAPTEISPFRVNVVAELALVVLIMSAIHTEVNREELGERDLVGDGGKKSTRMKVITM